MSGLGSGPFHHLSCPRDPSLRWLRCAGTGAVFFVPGLKNPRRMDKCMYNEKALWVSSRMPHPEACCIRKVAEDGEPVRGTLGG